MRTRPRTRLTPLVRAQLDAEFYAGAGALAHDLGVSPVDLLNECLLLGLGMLRYPLHEGESAVIAAPPGRFVKGKRCAPYLHVEAMSAGAARRLVSTLAAKARKDQNII